MENEVDIDFRSQSCYMFCWLSWTPAGQPSTRPGDLVTCAYRAPQKARVGASTHLRKSISAKSNILNQIAKVRSNRVKVRNVNPMLLHQTPQGDHETKRSPAIPKNLRLTAGCAVLNANTVHIAFAKRLAALLACAAGCQCQ